MIQDPIRVLLIEDDLVCVKMVECYLKKSCSEFDLTSVGTLREGIELLRHSPVDVVISDLSLPDSSGMDTVLNVSNNPSGVPLIVLTGNDCREIHVAAMQAGAQDFMEKGQLSSHTLERTIQHTLQRHQYQAKIETLLSEVGEKNSELEEQKRELTIKNRRLNELNQAAHSFVDNVSHEFRAPLNVVNDYVSLVRDAMVGPINNEQRQMLDVVSAKVDDLNSMVDDLNDVSCIESGTLRTLRRSCSLHDIARAVTPVLNRKAETRDIQFKVDFPADLPNVFCDAEKIVRVVINVASSAMKLSDSFGKVRLWASADKKSGTVHIGVDGTGQGIPIDELESIQQRLATGQFDLRDGCRNFGLGLNIARELVELNLGKMEIHSEVGIGNVVSFCLSTSEPEQVMRRYLQQVQLLEKAERTIELFKISAVVSTDQHGFQDLESLFQAVLCADDLLIGNGDGSWLLAVASVRTTSGQSFQGRGDQFVSSLEDEKVRQEQRRLSSSLPQFEIVGCGNFGILSEAQNVMDIVHAEFSSDKHPNFERATPSITDFAFNRD